MKPELEKKLFNMFPDLYRDHKLPDSVSRMGDGFCVGDGWYDIIEDLSVKIDILFLKNKLNENDYPSVFQVKEKFGGLRYYMNDCSKLSAECKEELYTLIQEAEAKASQTCQVCGKPGHLVDDGHWLVTLCVDHIKKES